MQIIHMVLIKTEEECWVGGFELVGKIQKARKPGQGNKKTFVLRENAGGMCS